METLQKVSSFEFPVTASIPRTLFSGAEVIGFLRVVGNIGLVPIVKLV